MLHIPNGLTCCGCAHAYRLCNHLKFSEMKVIVRYPEEQLIVVKCIDYVKKVKVDESFND